MEQTFNSKAGYVVAGYNDMLLYGSANQPQNCPMLIGFEVAMPLLLVAVAA